MRGWPPPAIRQFAANVHQELASQSDLLSVNADQGANSSSTTETAMSEPVRCTPKRHMAAFQSRYGGEGSPDEGRL